MNALALKPHVPLNSEQLNFTLLNKRGYDSKSEVTNCFPVAAHEVYKALLEVL